MLGLSNTASNKSIMDEDDPIRAAWRKSYSGLGAIAVFSVFINILRLAAPLYVLQILDRVISSRSLETLFMLTAITIIAIVCGILLEVTRRRLFMHWGHWIERSFGPFLFVSGMKKGGQRSPESSSILRDLGTVKSFVEGKGLIAWLDIVWAPVFIGIIFLISPPLAYIVLVGSLVALFMGYINERITRDSRNATHSAGQEDREWIAVAERNRETVGSLSVVNSFKDLWSRSVSSRLDEGMRTQTVNIYFAATMRFIGRFVRIGVLGLGIWLVIDDVLTLGSVIAANVLGRTAYSLVQSAMFRWRAMLQSKRAYARIKKTVSRKRRPWVSRSSLSTPQPLVLEEVSYRYPRQPRSVLRRLNLTLNPGELLCVIGPCASGKSTFCRLVSGLMAPRAGKIWLGDVDIYRLQQNSVHREIGYLSQDVTLFQGTVRENIASMSEGHMDQVVEAAKLAGIHEAILNLPQGYDTEIVEKEPLLSAGQRKSIAVARTFYDCPPMVIMDEPFPHLDSVSKAALMEGVNYLRSKGTIVILTTQQQAMANVADKVILFEENKFVVLNSTDEINSLSKQNDIMPDKKELELVKNERRNNTRRRRRSSRSKDAGSANK